VHFTFLRQRTESKGGTGWGLYGDAIIEGSFSPDPSLIVFGIYPTVRRKSFVSSQYLFSRKAFHGEVSSQEV